MTDLIPLVENAALLLGGGGAVHLLDRWRYRRKPALDVAALAQQVAATTMEHARAEIDRTWAAAEKRVQAAEAEMHRLHAEVAELRTRLDQGERRAESEIADLRTKLAAAQADAAAKQSEIDRLRGLTEHAQNQLGASAGAGSTSPS